MISKLQIFNYIDYDEYLKNGFSDENCVSSYSINPYNENHYKDTSEEGFVSYSFIGKENFNYSQYLGFENKVLAFFEELFSIYSIYSLENQLDRVRYTEYYNFLAFQNDVRLCLREIKRIIFIVDEIKLVIDCNFDLIPALFFYSDEGDAERIKLIFKKLNYLYLRKLK